MDSEKDTVQAGAQEGRGPEAGPCLPLKSSQAGVAGGRVGGEVEARVGADPLGLPVSAGTSLGILMAQRNHWGVWGRGGVWLDFRFILF